MLKRQALFYAPLVWQRDCVEQECVDDVLMCCVLKRLAQMDPEEKEKMEKRDWLAEKIQMLNTQLEGFEADVEKAVSLTY